jgi:hypothetical protein
MVIFKGVPMYEGAENEGIGKPITSLKTKVLLELGFLAGWILIFTLILRFTSTKARSQAPLGHTFLINKAAQGRAFSIIFCGIFALALGGFIYVAFIEEKFWNWTTILLYLGEGLAFYAVIYLLFRIDRLQLDFSTRTYHHDFGFLWNRKRYTSTFQDFQCIRLTTEEHSTSEGGSYKTWDIYLLWNDPNKRPIQLDRRPRGFHDFERPPDETSREQAREFSQKMDLPFRDDSEKI